MRLDPYLIELVALQEEGRSLSLSLSLSLSPSLHMHTQRQDHRRRQPTATQGESSHQTPMLLAPWSWNPRLQNCEKIIFCCLSHLVYDILLWQHKQTERKEILLLRRPVEAKDWKQWVLLCEWPLTTVLGEPSVIQWGEDLLETWGWVYLSALHLSGSQISSPVGEVIVLTFF